MDKVENTDFTVDRERGIVTFTTAPGESPVKGQDNVQITASKVREDYLDAINKCTIAAVYGVGGSTDRGVPQRQRSQAGHRLVQQLRGSRPSSLTPAIPSWCGTAAK